MSLLRSALQGIRIPFEGEPIAGLQLMGMLETRTLDFENLVILSLGEDIFPRGLSAPSLIPYNLRRGFGLPTVEQHEAMYAYYFYRLLQRAKRVRLVYNSQATDSSTGEMSRYLRQLMLESPHSVPVRSVTYSVTYTKPKPIVVEKSGEVAELLREYLDGGARALSASSLNSYMACPLKFYFEKIAQLHEPDEVTEEVDGRMLGNIFHRTMQALYKPLLNQNITEESIKSLLGEREKIAELVEKFTAEEFFGNENEADEVHRNGKLLMVKEAVVKYATGTLRYDLQHAPFTLAGLEEKVEGSIAVAIGGSRHSVRFTGSIDRRDVRSQHVCIIDYKTGSADDKKARFASLEALFDESAKLRRPEVFQTLLYSLLVHKRDAPAAVQPALYFVRGIYRSELDSVVKLKSAKGYEAVDDATPYLPRFEELLQSKLGELFDTARPFVQTDEADTCTRCPYKEICHK
jgi:RecB family exonuclease